ncbi:uncharacterized protein LTR77_010084 [Saxophila tyrrhenica]|uniref:Cupin type-1 domain-containing protein n=1 Tax=Saxophila tyrrhenica TaxID=1690608 RepID=A0AAV9P0W7_9PEZI|nr:hypothetical protein LTR77_010084 [Saxophila tyrrhenica]
MATYQSTNLRDRVATINQHWTPQHVLTLNDSHSLKLATISGPFIWHCHPDTDEMFYVVSGGPFKLELSTQASSPEEAESKGADEVVELKLGDVFSVPKGMQHRPVAAVPTGILMIEKVGTVNTGDREGDERTVRVDEGRINNFEQEETTQRLDLHCKTVAKKMDNSSKKHFTFSQTV